MPTLLNRRYSSNLLCLYAIVVMIVLWFWKPSKMTQELLYDSAWIAVIASLVMDVYDASKKPGDPKPPVGAPPVIAEAAKALEPALGVASESEQKKAEIEVIKQEIQERQEEREEARGEAPPMGDNQVMAAATEAANAPVSGGWYF